MPRKELGDRVHNFFAQENAPQGQHHSQENWPVQSNNFWVGGQRQTEVPDSNSNNYNLQNSGDVDRGPDSHAHHMVHGLNFPQSNLRPEFAKSQSLNEQTNLNGFIYGNQFHQARQNEANFPTANRDSDQGHLITSRGLSGHELHQGSGSDHRAKSSGGAETSVSFDLFNGKQQMSHLQSNLLQSLQHQQSGIGDMQQFQQQYIRKMQELQMQQQLQQFDVAQQNMINQVPHFAKQASGGQSSQVNNTLNSETLHYPWASEVGANWLNQGSPAMQGSANGLVYPQNLGQSQQVLGLGPQQVDQSLYGVPVCSSRGLSINEYSHAVRDRSSLPQTPVSTHTLQGNHHNVLSAQVGVLEGSSRQKFQNEDMWRLASSQSGNTRIRNTGGIQQVNTMSKKAPQQDLLGRQESAVRTEALPGKPAAQVSASQNEVALDPTEEKILFGSDDNIWAAFGKIPHMNGEAGNSFEHDELSNGLPSIHSGSWSALMQSAVAETSSNDAVPQEEWSSLVFNNNAGPSAHQPPSVYNDSDKVETTFVDNNIPMPHSPSDDINDMNITGLNQFRHKFQNEPGKKMQFDMSQQLVQSGREATKWSNRSQPRHPLETERNAETISTPCPPAENRTRQQPNVWNAVIPSGGDRVQNNHEKLSQNSQSNQLRVMQGEVFHGNSLKKSNSNPGSVELVHGVSTGQIQANNGILTLHNASSVSIPSNVGVGDETSFFQLNNWKNASMLAKSQAGESLGNILNKFNESSQVLDSLNGHDKEEVARCEKHNRDKRENFSESHRSNLSRHTFGSFGEIGLSDANDSQALPSVKQKSSNQVTRKVSVPRKFQYHPMGNLDEHVEPAHDLKLPTSAQAAPQHNIPFVQSNLFGQAPKNSTLMGKGQSSQLQNESKGSDEEKSRRSVPGYAPNISVPTSRSFDTYALNRVSSTSQNMLELLHKVDQSMDQSEMMEFSYSELPESGKFDGAGHIKSSQSSVSQGFGLQLGPPSQRPQNSDHPLSSQNAEGALISLHSSHSAAETVENSRQIVPSSSFQSLPFTGEEIQNESKITSAMPGHAGNEKSLYKIPEHFPSAFSSGNLYASNHLQSQQTARVSGQLLMHRQSESFIGSASCSEQRGSGECVIPNTSASSQEDNHASHGVMSQRSTPNDVHERVPAATNRSGDHMQTHHFTLPGISGQRDSSQQSQTMWTNVPTKLHTLGAEFKGLTHFQESLKPNTVESSSGLLTPGYVKSQGSVDGHELRLKEISGHLGTAISSEPDLKMKESLGKSSSIKYCSGDSPSNSASTLNGIEAFGRSLKPNSSSHQSYSLPNQMQALKDAETDANNGVSKRVKGSDNLFDTHQVALKTDQHNEHNAVVGESRGTDAGVASDGSGMLIFSQPAGILQRNTSQPGNLPTKDVSVIGRGVSQSNSSSDYMASVRVDLPQISPHMAPSWLNQYGTFKNGQVWPKHDTHKLTTLRAGEPLSAHVKVSNGLDTVNSADKATASHLDACQVDNSRENCISSTVANEEVSSQSSQLNLTRQHMNTLRSKKRSATSELHPWHKEVSEGSQDCWSLSIAERDWSKATNRLIEKDEDDADLIGDKKPVLRSRRRLKLTTQLMQQLFFPAPAAILSSDATSDYESVAYAVSRVVLGDACSTVSRSSDSRASCDDIDMLSAKEKLSDKNRQRTEKNVEKFMERARKLENDFLRLDKSASVLDSKVESQELEKFAVINRLARFHGRWQADSAEATSADAAAATQKPVPQRYVTALPIPRSLPDRVQYLSL